MRIRPALSNTHFPSRNLRRKNAGPSPPPLSSRPRPRSGCRAGTFSPLLRCPHQGPGSPLRGVRDDTGKEKLIRLSPTSPKLHASFSQGAGPVPFGLWEGRPGGWEAVGVTAHSFSRDVDPGKPDQKAGRESRLARLSSRRGHVSNGKWSRPGSAEVIPKTARNSGGSEEQEIALRFPEERERPTDSRRTRGGRKRPLRKHLFYPGAAAPAARGSTSGARTPPQTRMAPPVRIRIYENTA